MVLSQILRAAHVPINSKTKRRELHAIKHCVEHFHDVDDWVLSLMVNEFVIAQ